MRSLASLGMTVALLGITPAAQAQFSVQAGATKSADTVRIGDPFTVVVGIRAPRGSKIEFPAIPDSTGVVQALDPRTIRASAASTANEQFATYRVAAWDVGTQPIRFDDAVVTFDGATRKIPLAGNTIYVQSVLPP